MLLQSHERISSGGTLVGLLQTRAGQTPSKILYNWLASGEKISRSLSSLELQKRAGAIAAHLQSLRLEQRLALLLYAPGLEFVEGFFACLYAGIIAIPAYPPRTGRDRERIQNILKDAGCGAVLTTSDSVQSVREIVGNDAGIQCVATDEISTEWVSEWREEEPRSNEIAYLQYTSGSTSSPKGVMITHSNVLANLQYIAANGGFDESSVSVSWLPHFHDMGLIYGILQPLHAGFEAMLMSPASFLHNPLRWLTAISRYRGTHCGAPNFAYDLCVDRIGEIECADLNLSSWRVAFNGAEPVRKTTLDRFEQCFGRFGFSRNAFYPVYGLAEASLKVSSGELGEGPRYLVVDAEQIKKHKVLQMASAESGYSIVSCGRSGGEHQVVIVNPESRERCGTDEIGEIWTAGPSVAAGYWRNDSATQATFCARLAGGEGPYLRTGDLGFLHEGNLYITGRLKDCIIVRGRNHYPQDIEYTVVNSHSALRPGGSIAFSCWDNETAESVAVVSEVNRSYRESLEDVITAMRKAVAEEHEIRLAAVVLVKSGSVPRTSSNKLRRQECKVLWERGALPVLRQSIATPKAFLESSIPITSALVLNADLADATTMLEEYLLDLVSCVTGHPREALSPNQTLIAYGVDSLAIFDLKWRIERELAVSLAFKELLTGTVHGICVHILQALQTGNVETVWNVRKEPAPRRVPLSPAQEQLWLIQQLDPTSCAYNETVTLELRGPLLVLALRSAVNELVRRHEVLRTRFVIEDGTPWQIVLLHAEVPFPVSTQGGPAITKGAIQETVRSLAEKPFDLQNEAPVRFHLLQLSQENWIFILVAHHIVCDGPSLPITVNELGTLYEAQASGKASPLPELPLQYSDYALRERAWMQNKKYEEQLGYWKKTLADVSVLELPTDHSITSVTSDAGNSVHCELSPELLAQLRQVGQEKNTTLFMLLVTAMQVLLSKYCGQEDIAMGTAVTNREPGLTSALIGLFVNTVVLRTRVKPMMSFVETLAQVSRNMADAYDHQNVPFANVTAALRQQSGFNQTPLLQVMAIAQQMPPAPVEYGNVCFSVAEIVPAAEKFELTMRLLGNYSGAQLRLEYKKDLWDSTTIERMLGHLVVVLEEMVRYPEKRVGDTDLLRGREREQVLWEWQGRRVERAGNRSVHEWIAEQSRNAGEEIA
ncbi:MAG: AMP-binding protein, partial [Acidobacteriia bacterium]|nr:AMP-binding protein [Terriglobia bacterium]